MEQNLAVLIDFENIAAGTEKEGLGRFDVNSLMQRVKDKGRILVARSYADWGRFSRFKQTLLTNNVTMMELTSHGMQDKNRADIAMVVDALELAFTRDYINTFVVVSGDSDFTPMVLKMRELNKRVIGIGTRKSTSRLLIQACDEFMFYDSIVQSSNVRKDTRRRKKPKSGGRTADLDKAYDLLEDALRGLQREMPDPPLASVVKSAMNRKSPDFNESDLGYASFARFLEAAQDAGVVLVTRDRKSGGYRVDSVDEGKASAGEPDAAAPESDDWEDEYLPSGADEALAVLKGQGLPVLGAPGRLAVLEALESVVAERKRRRRKTTLQFVRDDLRKKLRNTHPNLPGSLLKGVLDALMQAGELIHRDGTAIRSASASFQLNKDAEALNVELSKLYLGVLLDKDADVGDTATLAELFLGHRDQQRDIEMTLAWLQSESERESDAGLNDVDLDDLLVMGDSGIDDEPAEAVEAAPEEEKPKKRASRSRKKKTEEPPADLDDDLLLEAAPEPEPEPEPEPKPKKKTASRSRKKKTEEPPAEEATIEAADAEEAPKKRVRRRKKPEPPPEESGLEGLMEAQPGPE